MSPGTAAASPFVRAYRNGKLLPAFASRTLDIIEIPALAARVKAEGPVRFLVAPLWPVDAYGVLGAEKKAGKTWADLDLAVSVVLVLKWFGRYDVERQGDCRIRR